MAIIEDIDLAQNTTGDQRRANLIENVNVPQVPFPKEYKDFVSKIVAEKLLRVFEVSTLGILSGGALLIIFAIQRSYSPKEAATLVEKTIVPFLRGAATFATTVFGPLLAFILGFYFAKAETSRSEKHITP